MPQPRRYAVVGTGSRGQMFVRALVTRSSGTMGSDTARLVALADPNAARIGVYQRLLAELGAPPARAWDSRDFATMLAKERVDTVLVTTVDRTHDSYIVAALEAGCDVITEKPMTVDATRCRRILDAVERTGRRVTVTFNYRYNPIHEQVRRLLAENVVGEIGSVHFEWLLDVRHGADYFRRWHRDKRNSGGLLVHKATHHFDLVNWWLQTGPEQVYAAGRRFFYGEQGARHGYDRGYERAHGAPEAEDDPFALRLADQPDLRELYLEAEHLDGYHRDQNVFAPGVTIEDDLAVLVRYRSGATMTYHLTAYAPWEGYRIMFNGSQGRLELDVVENDHVSRTATGGLRRAEPGRHRLSVHPYWQPSYEVPVDGHTREGHGGADARMTEVLFGEAGEPNRDHSGEAGEANRDHSGEDGGRTPDPLGRAATERDGAASLLVGLAGNVSLETGAPVRVADLLTVPGGAR